MYMYLGFIVPVYSTQTFRLFNISVRGRDRDRGRVHTQYKWALRDKLIPYTQFPMNPSDNCIQEYKHLS